MHRVLAFLVLAACERPPATLDEPTQPDPTQPDPTEPDPTTPPVETVAFDELAFFQSVKVAVVADGATIDAAQRNAPIIAGREAIVRARVTVPSDWAGGALELAVDLVADGVTETFRATATDLADGLVVEIPAEQMTADATWAATISEGAVVHDRFPDAGEADLQALVTGVLKLRVVPFDVNGFVPDTGPAVLEGYRAALMATYPVTDVLIEVAPVEPWDGALDLGDINSRVGVIQEDAMYSGAVDWDVYYYGMATGVASRDQYDGITGTSEDGGPPENLVRAYYASGAAFGDQKAEDTLIHEIGHTHRLLHTPCDDEPNTDPDYPYAGGAIGIEGYDIRTDSFVSPDTKDLMSYCFPRWVSDFSYAKLAEHVVRTQDYEGPQ